MLTPTVGASSCHSDHYGFYYSLHLRLQISSNLALDIQSHLPYSRWYVQHAHSPLTILGRHNKPNPGFVVTALAEVTGKFVMGKGVASSFRPRRYYKIPKETLEASLDDLEQLINFFVIEFQRILFAENPIVTITVSMGISYFPLPALVTEPNSTLLRHSLLLSSPTTSSRSFLFGAWPSSALAPSSSDH